MEFSILFDLILFYKFCCSVLVFISISYYSVQFFGLMVVFYGEFCTIQSAQSVSSENAAFIVICRNVEKQKSPRITCPGRCRQIHSSSVAMNVVLLLSSINQKTFRSSISGLLAKSQIYIYIYIDVEMQRVINNKGMRKESLARKS